jgi:hypothetical protein
MYLTVQTMKLYSDDTDEDNLCTSTNRPVQSLQTNKHCNDCDLRLNLIISLLGRRG